MINNLLGYLKTKNIERLKKIGKFILGLLLLIIILYESRQFLKTFDFGSTLKLIRTYSPGKLFSFLIIGLGVVGLTFLYDFTAAKRLNLKISIPRLFKVSWIANAFNNVTGAFPAGAGVRVILYRSKDVSDAEIGKMNILLIPATVTGLGILMMVDLVGLGGIGEILNRHWWIVFLILGYIAYVLAYCWFTDISFSKIKIKIGHNPNIDETITRILLTGISALDWSMSVLLLWMISNFINPGITYLETIGIFSIATAVGIVSMIPGGIGSFDLMLLSGLQLHGSSSDEALATLVLFRFFYYLVPLTIGGVLAITEFSQVLRRFSKGVIQFAFFTETDDKQLTYQNPSLIVGEYAIKMLYVMVLIGGLLLVLSASTPGIPDRIHFLANLLSLRVLQISHRISLFIGLILLLLSKEILNKIRRAWSATLILLGLGAIFTFFKGIDIEEALYLMITFALLLLAKPAFFRVSSPLSLGRNILSLLLTIVSVLFYILSTQPTSFSFYNSHKGISLLHFTPNDFVLNGIAALLLSWISYGIWRILLQKPTFPETPVSVDELYRVDNFLENHKGNEDTHQIYMRDKKLFWACEGEVLIPYQVTGSYLVVLGEPIGDSQLLKSALNEFEMYSTSYGYWPVFYQVSDDLMPLLHEYGYDFFKLGEEAHVNLEEFEISMPQYSSLRNARNRIERQGYYFEVIRTQEEVELILEELKSISDLWLNNRKEKRFSLGFFDNFYLKRAPVALVKNSGGEIIAFASIMPAYDGHKEISIDLMRYIPASPNGLMDYLFLNMFIWAKHEGYEYFNLGMAPLYNVGSTRFSKNEEAMASILYQHGSKIYSFEGLYHYKDKFKPQWKPRYLAFPEHTSLASVILKVARLIN